MSTTTGSLERPRIAALGALATAAVLAGVLVIQHHRHGWPFSLHHGLPAATLAADPGARARPVAAAKDALARTAVQLDAVQIERAGLRLEAARVESITQPMRTVATVVPDESRVSHVHARVAGWLERLDVNTTGQAVTAGQPLAAIFSQELFASQTEYLVARKQAADAPDSGVIASARSRLKVLGMTDAEVADIERLGEARRLVTVVAPRSGIVLHRGVAVGTAIDPSTEIVTVADLSRVWILAEVPESAIAQVTKGTSATLEFQSSGRARFESRVEFVHPTLSERSRTLRVRFAIANADGAMRPGMYGTADFRIAPRSAVTVPRDAVVDSGGSQHLFVATAADRFEPRRVTVGARLPERVEILDGLAAGEPVVAAGVFLLDSESRLRASGSAGTGHGGHGTPAAASEPAADEKHAEHGD